MTPWAKRLAALLALSVGLNLLFAGFLVGRRMGGPPARERFDAPPESGSALAPGARRHPALRAALEKHRDELRERREGVRKARAAAREALGRGDFDRALVERSLASLKEETARSQELTHRVILEAAERAQPEQRRELGKALGGFERPKRR